MLSSLTTPALPELVDQCEICGQLGKLDSANICGSCYAEGLKTIRREEDEYAALIDAEVKWALSVGLCSPEQVEM